MMDIYQQLAIRKAESMRVFADGEEFFCLGDWRAWEAACMAEGRTIPPAEFKALPKEERRKHVMRPNDQAKGLADGGTPADSPA
jgi:hypothetical protein